MSLRIKKYKYLIEYYYISKKIKDLFLILDSFFFLGIGLYFLKFKLFVNCFKRKKIFSFFKIFIYK